jgi:hypothetical protein
MDAAEWKSSVIRSCRHPSRVASRVYWGTGQCVGYTAVCPTAVPVGGLAVGAHRPPVLLVRGGRDALEASSGGMA